MAERIVADYPPIDSDSNPAKQAVSRGARACTVCRAAKMKCVGAEEDGAKPCQRCRRSNSECVFEKHRRGRKPGSKLSEASKMLRKLEKGAAVPSQKAKPREPADTPTHTPFPVSDSRSAPPPESSRYPPPYYVPSHAAHPSQLPPAATTPFPTLTSSYPQPAPLPAPPCPPPRHPPTHAPSSSTSSPLSPRSHMEGDDEDDDERDDETMYPAKMVEREGRRHSYFGTVLTNPTPTPGPKPTPHHGRSKTSPSHSPGHHPRYRHPTAGPSRPILPAIDDPVAAGIISELELADLFDIIFKRLNPFVNLLDPALHSPAYVRSHCPFLFTVLVMAGSKFFKQGIFRAVQRIAEEMCLRAFQEGWKRVEVIQAFMCMTYWKDPDDTRTWTYIGYAARMAVEIGLNTYCAEPPPGESVMHKLERRNRERTYLVLWVHDRSLSMQTGRQWMLPEDELVRHAEQWHRGSNLLPIDVVVAAQVALRRIAAGVTDMFYLSRGKRVTEDVNYAVLLTGTNQRLQQWNEHWMDVVTRLNGTAFHTSLLTFFKLHVRLFLNSFGLQSSLIAASNSTPSPSNSGTICYAPSLPALSICYTSAVETLRLVSKELANVDMLRYGQDSITVMTAYSACFLLKLCRSPVAGPELGDGAQDTIYSLINATGDAYQDCARAMSAFEASSSAVEYHGRFLKTLVMKDKALKARMAGRERRRGEGSEQFRDHSGAVHGYCGTDVDGGTLARLTPPNSATNANISYARHQQNGTGSSSTSKSTSTSHAAPNDTNSNGNGTGNHQVHSLGNIYQPRPTHPPGQSPPPPPTQTPSQYWHFPASPHLPAHPLVSPDGGLSMVPGSYALDDRGPVNGGGNASGLELDEGPNQKMEVAYWYTMHSELGYGHGVTPTAAMYVNMPQQQQYRTLDHQQQQTHQQHHIQQYGVHNGSLPTG